MPQTGELPRAAPILWALLRIFISAHLLCRVAEAERSLLLLLLLPLYFLLPQRLKQTKRRTAPVTANRLTAPFLHPALPTVVPWTSDWRAPHEFHRFNVTSHHARHRDIPRKPHHSPSHHAVGGDNGERHT